MPIATSYHNVKNAQNVQNVQNYNQGPWFGGKSCNPCNQVPWIPIMPNNNLYSNPTGQYAANAGSVGYVSSTSYQINTQHHTPQSGSFKVNSVNNHGPSSDYSAPSSQFNHNNQPPLSFDNPSSSSFGGHSSSSSSNFQSSNGPELDHPPDSFNHQSSLSSFEHSAPPGLNFQSSDGPELDHPPPDYNQGSSNFDYSSSSHFESQRPSEYEDQPPSSSFEQHHQSSDLIGVVKEPNSDTDHIESSHIQTDADHAESRPANTSIKSISALSSSPEISKNTLTVHFQRSPLIDLSIAGESTTTTSTTTKSPIFLSNRSTSRGRIRSESSTIGASVIDYIVSGPDESFTSDERDSINQPSLIATTTTRTANNRPTTTTAKTKSAPDQKQQGSILQTLVQNYELYKKSNGSEEIELPAVRVYNDTDDYGSVSREIVVSNTNPESGKKNKQVSMYIHACLFIFFVKVKSTQRYHIL